MAVKTRAARKRRLARARAHQKVCTEKAVTYERIGAIGGVELLPFQKKLVDRVLKKGVKVELSEPQSTHATGPAQDTASQEQPTRANCPTCGFRQKVRKDGTMSRHDVFHGSDATECSGTGQRWDSAPA